MSSLYNIDSSCLRYIVPFKYNESFEEAFAKVETNIWERHEAANKRQESDLYDYVRNEFCFEDDPKEPSDRLPENKTGCEWVLRGSELSSCKNGHGIKQLLYYPDGLKDEHSVKINILLSNVGLLLFRNGLGFFWYEIKLPKDGFDSDMLKTFQNVVRELNRERASVFWEKQNTCPFSFGCWVNQSIDFLDVTYLAARKSAYHAMVENSLSQSVQSCDCIVSPDMDAYSDDEKLPDKAILFTYASLIGQKDMDSDRDRCSFIYHVANGYKDSYHFSDEVSADIKKPFDDVYWYATQEGAAYLAWPSDDNRAVFSSLMPGKVKSDYFTLYIKTLYQSFSLLIYAEKIQSEISAVSDRNFERPLQEKLSGLFGDINLFLAKSMATSVSHIHHQSEFYVYLKRQLRVHEDVKSVTAGLNALDTLQREHRQREENRRVQEAWQAEQKRDREAQAERAAREEREKKSDGKIQAIMGLFALLGISSALVDCFDFIGKFDPESGDFWGLVCSTKWWEIAFFVVIGIISVTAIVVSVKAIVNAFKNKD